MRQPSTQLSDSRVRSVMSLTQLTSKQSLQCVGDLPCGVSIQPSHLAAEDGQSNLVIVIF